MSRATCGHKSPVLYDRVKQNVDLSFVMSTLLIIMRISLLSFGKPTHLDRSKMLAAGNQYVDILGNDAYFITST